MSNEPITLTGRKVMVVDDVKENLELMTQFLEIEGYEVSFAMDGEKAIKLANLEPPDLILLDVMMPGIDGFETCRRLKSMSNTRDIPIIFVTGKAELQNVVEGFQIGAVDYITKPIQQDEVRVRVHTHLQLRELLVLRDELIEQLTEHNAQNQQLLEIQRQQLVEAEKLAGLGELVGQLCHELGTPIGTSITATTTSIQQIEGTKQKLEQNSLQKKDLLRMLELDGQSQEIINSNLQYAADLISSFKQVAVDQFGGQKTCFEVGAYVKHVLNILQPRLKKTNHEIEVNSEGELFLDSYPGAFTQLLINLVNNSLLHGLRDDVPGKISIDLRKDEGAIVLDYRDNGRGIPETNLKNIFNKYFTTAKNSGGSGLGLYILKQIVEDNLHGKVTCNSGEGQGVQFLLTIPMQEEEELRKAESSY